MVRGRSTVGLFALVTGAWVLAVSGSMRAVSPQQAPPATTPTSSQGSVASASPRRAVLQRYCLSCHNQRVRSGDLILESYDIDQPNSNPELSEKIITRLRAGSMPPTGLPRPDHATYDSLATFLEDELDRAWAARPTPGRINAVHRLNRVEYNNAIRDLFALEFDVKPLLPGDETADGSFDNFADVLTISTAHLERYLSVARQVSRLATGLPPTTPAVARFAVPLHVVQEDRQSEDLPFGSRGGLAVRHTFPVDGEYTIKLELQRAYAAHVIRGIAEREQIDLRLNGERVKLFTIGGECVGSKEPRCVAFRPTFEQATANGQPAVLELPA